MRFPLTSKTPTTEPENPNLAAYNAGVLAAKDGREHWANPHITLVSSQTLFRYWYAGWCMGKQIKENA